MGRLIYRVGGGKDGYRTNIEIPDYELPFKITEGEYEIIVDHDVAKNVLTSIKVNGIDVADQLALKERIQRVSQGGFDIRSAINNTTCGVSLQQFYWYYRVEKVN